MSCQVSTAIWPSRQTWACTLQCREEEEGTFVESMLSSGHGASRQPFMRRQDVALPPDRGWQWSSDWQVGALRTCFACIPISCILFIRTGCHKQGLA